MEVLVYGPGGGDGGKEWNPRDTCPRVILVCGRDVSRVRWEVWGPTLPPTSPSVLRYRDVRTVVHFGFLCGLSLGTLEVVDRCDFTTLVRGLFSTLSVLF